MNAVGLNSAVFNASRMVGPAVAGLLIAKVSIALCYFANAASFLAVLIAIVLMRQRRAPRIARTRRPAGKRPDPRRHPVHALRSRTAPVDRPDGIVGTLGLNFQTVMPLLTKFTFHGDSTTFGGSPL